MNAFVTLVDIVGGQDDSDPVFGRGLDRSAVSGSGC
jgi:hypothetical protein